MSFKIPDYILHASVKKILGQYKLTGGTGASPYNFRCPICGDSKKNPNLKRGYVLHNTGEWVYLCHNECGSMSYTRFLENYHPDEYKELCLHGFSKNENVQLDHRTSAEKTYVSIDPAFKPGELLSITEDHELCKIALKFVTDRKIRERVYKQWFVCLADEKFYDRDEGGNIKLDELGNPLGNRYKNRLIIPYYHFGGKWTQFDARALFPSQTIRYKNYKGVEREPYNIDWLDVTRPFFLLEGCINSTFIENSISFGGTKHFEKLIETNPDILKYKHNCYVIWDNDEAGYDGIPISIKYGFNWFNWNNVKTSLLSINKINDINDAVLDGTIFDIDSNGFITLSSLLKYCENAHGALLLSTLQYGDRDQIRKEKSKLLFDKMNSQRMDKNKIDFSWS